MKKVLAVLVLSVMTMGCAYANGNNRGYTNYGYNNSYRGNNTYNYAGAAIVGAVIGAVAVGIMNQPIAQPVPQSVCWQEPATTYVPNQYNQMVPITSVRTVCR
jgi:hypothetical protein